MMRTIAPTKTVLKDTEWTRVLVKLDDAGSTAKRGVTKRRMTELFVYNPNSVTMTVRVRRNAGTVNLTSEARTFLKVDLDPDDTLVFNDPIDLDANEEIDLKLDATPTTALEVSVNARDF